MLICISGLAGKTDFESAQADMVVDCIEDMFKPIMAILHQEDDAQKVCFKCILNKNIFYIIINAFLSSPEMKICYVNLHMNIYSYEYSFQSLHFII